MLFVLLIICIGLFVLGVIIDNISYDYDFIGTTMEVFGGVIGLIVVVAIMFVSGFYISNRTVDDKIAMYQEENKKIEEKIEVTVKQYMDFEKDTYKSLKVDTYVNLVSLYPELKSDKLIKEQIETYQRNNDKIKDLKLEKINQKTYKWWLFFGK